MRKPRINIFDDDPTNLKLLAEIMTERGYEVLTFDRAVTCPVYSDRAEVCPSLKPCADIVLTDNQMPLMTGIEMLLQQERRGCKVDVRNKAVLTASLDNAEQSVLKGLGCAYFKKPFRMAEISAWLDGCETRIDLSRPLGIIRKGDRIPVELELVCATPNDDRIFRATAVNFSENGLCLKTDTPLTAEQSIVIGTATPNGCRKASVRWVSSNHTAGYLAGFACS